MLVHDPAAIKKYRQTTLDPSRLVRQRAELLFQTGSLEEAALSLRELVKNLHSLREASARRQDLRPREYQFGESMQSSNALKLFFLDEAEMFDLNIAYHSVHCSDIASTLRALSKVHFAQHHSEAALEAFWEAFSVLHLRMEWESLQYDQPQSFTCTSSPECIALLTRKKEGKNRYLGLADPVHWIINAYRNIGRPRTAEAVLVWASTLEYIGPSAYRGTSEAETW